MAKLTQGELKFWESEAKSCIERQKRELIQRNNYPALILYYEGFEMSEVFYPHITTEQRLSIINEYFPNTNSLISEIMYQNPDLVIEALKPQAEGGEDLMKAALTYAMRKTGMLEENKLALFDMLYAGYSAIEVGHIIDTDELREIPSETQINERQGIIERLLQPRDAEDAEKKLAIEKAGEYEAYSTNENTYVRRWNPLKVVFDWRAERLKDMRYILKIVELSKAEFDTKYPEFKDKVTTSDDKLEYSMHDDQKYTRKIKLYEFQIRKRQNEYWNLIICPGYAKSEIDYFKRPYTTNGFNMKIGTLHKYGKLYPIAMAQINKKINDELNHYIRFIMEVAERNIPKYTVDKSKRVDIAALRSKNVNDIVEVDGIPSNAIHAIQPTNLSIENKELIAMFKDQKEKLWSVSESRMKGRSDAQFATELEIQEAGFQTRQADIQEGLRSLIQDELETVKDSIITFWDGAHFFKITGGEKPVWYEPQIDPITGMVLNPLTDILVGDYDIYVDISTALRPNKERRKKEIIEYLTWLTSPSVMQLLLSQNATINIDAIKKTAKDFGMSPETLIINIAQPIAQAGQASQVSQVIPTEQPIGV